MHKIELYEQFSHKIVHKFFWKIPQNESGSFKVKNKGTTLQCAKYLTSRWRRSWGIAALFPRCTFLARAGVTSAHRSVAQQSLGRAAADWRRARDASRVAPAADTAAASRSRPASATAEWRHAAPSATAAWTVSAPDLVKKQNGTIRQTSLTRTYKLASKSRGRGKALL